AGDSDAPFDEESYDIWKKLGLPQDHIFKYGKDQNWWGPVGPTGPCGPDTEMFYDTNPKGPGPQDPAANPRFVEIWNDVFMEYDKQKDGSFKTLKQKNVDTGMGLERMLAVLSGVSSIYETDVFLPLVKNIEDLAANFDVKSARIVADHIRAAVFLISDGVTPSNLERGYILRRLTRRAIRHASLVKIESDFLEDLAQVVIKTYGDFYPNLIEFQESIAGELKKEEAKFKKALEVGIGQFERIGGDISGRAAFDLYQNFGFPIELTIELATGAGKKVDTRGFEKELKSHQQLSRLAGQKTKGGLAVQSEQAAKLHTATHLLHQALRDVLGSHVHQTGSYITNERLRFDFSHNEKLTAEQIKRVQLRVNQKIRENLRVNQKVMPKEAADQIGAIGLFDQKYGDLVNIYYMGKTGKIKDAYSKEFCGGPHAASTGTLGKFEITKEESAGSGVRRIYATISG
ncbi:MAG: alanine--tRNA ligase, partial [Patescibacteria group bacterium]